MPYANTWVGVVAPVGQSGVNSTSDLTCPPGHYVSKVVGGKKVGGYSSVTNINTIECTNYMNPSAARVVVSKMIGKPGEARSFDCGPAGLSGMLLKASAVVDFVQPICGTDLGTKDVNAYLKGYPWSTGASIGGPNAPQFAQWCAAGGRPAGNKALITSISGGPANNGNHPNCLSMLSFTCKDFADIDAVKNDPERTADVCIGTDPLTPELSGAIDCGASMKGYCTGTRAWSNKCNIYVGKVPSQAADQDRAKMDHCSTGQNFKSQVCQDFCLAGGVDMYIPGGPGRPAFKDQCNVLYANKCKGDTSDLCSCVNKPRFEDWGADQTYQAVMSAVNGTAGANRNSQCYFGPCKERGYKAVSFSKAGCPSCLNSITVAGTEGGVASLGSAVQSCLSSDALSTATTPAAAPSESGTSSTSPGSPQTPAPSPPKGWLYALLILVAVILVAALLEWVFTGDKPTPRPAASTMNHAPT
jgi:hypothetical protein